MKLITFLKTGIVIAAMILTSINAWGQITDSIKTTGAGTWTCPPGVKSVKVECWGGGGAGGAAKNVSSAGVSARGGGGAGGGYSRSININVAPGTSYNCSVGAGALGVVLTLDNEVAPSGGNTFFKNALDAIIVNAPGGNGGIGRLCGTGQTYGTAVSYSGHADAIGEVIYDGGGGSLANATLGTGQGGSSGGTESNGTSGSSSTRTNSIVIGGGFGAGGKGGAGNGGSGGVPGGAGSGAKADATQDRLGGNGGNGLIVITYTADTPNGIENNKKTTFQVYVNANNQIVIAAPAKSNYGIYNAVGMLMERGELSSQKTTLNSKLKQGVYVVKVNNESTKVVLKR